MKAVVVILALAVITGCNARALDPAPTDPQQWEQTVERFWQYVADLKQKATGGLEHLRAPEMTRELDTLISDTMAELAVYRDDIQTKLGSYADAGQLSQELQLLANKLQKDMQDAKERSTVYLGELMTTVELNSDDVRNRITTYSNKLKKRLEEDTEKIRDTVATYLGELQSRASQNMAAVREGVEPSIQQASETVSQKLADVSAMLNSQTEGLSQKLESQAEALRTQLESATEELRASLEGKLEELTKVLAPYATKLREQFEAIGEQVKAAGAN